MEVDRQFEEWLNDSEFKEQVKESLRKRPSDMKWQLLWLEKKKNMEKHLEDRAATWTEKLAGSPEEDVMISLGVRLRGEGRAWLTSFAMAGGVLELLRCV